jgi:hypothetical protein
VPFLRRLAYWQSATGYEEIEPKMEKSNVRIKERIEELKKSEDYFYCERFRCWMPMTDCVGRQKKKVAYYFRPDNQFAGPKYLECVDCPQGIDVARKLKGLKIRRIKKLNADKVWQRRAEEQGFKNEKEMWEYLFREWSSNAIAEIWGTNFNTPLRRAKECGVQMRPKGGPRKRIKLRCPKCKKILVCVDEEKDLWRKTCKCVVV